MGWRASFYFLFFLLTLVEFSSRPGKLWLLHLDANPPSVYSWAISSASIFVLVALVLSMYLIVEHLAAYNQPEEQKFLIGLILMVPVYALESFLSLLDSNAAFNCQIIRDCYEAFALYCFERYLIACLDTCMCSYGDIDCTHVGRHANFNNLCLLSCHCGCEKSVLDEYSFPPSLLIFPQSVHQVVNILNTLDKVYIPVFDELIALKGGEKSTVEFMESQRLIDCSTPLLEEAYTYGVVEHPFPLNCFLREWYLGPDFYQAVKVGIVQYMILKMICALLAIFLEFLGVYGEGKFEWRYGYPYLAVVLNFSQTWALYCLVQFYTVTKDKLEPIKPLAKFLVFKSIVFLTWWQGVAVAFLFSIGAFKGSLAQELKTRIQDYIICFEMGVAAVVHLYVFPAVPYQRGERCVRNVSVMADYASLDTPPDPEEVRDCERSTRIRLARHDERENRLNFPQSVRDVVLGSGEIIVDDMKFTVSHVVEPVERGIAKINETFQQISENVKRHEERKRNTKDDSYVIPLNSWRREFSEVHDNLVEGSVSDSGLSNGKRQHYQTKATPSRRSSR